jgi:hypothetical protein
MQALGHFLAGLDQAVLIFAEAVGRAGFDPTAYGEASGLLASCKAVASLSIAGLLSGRKATFPPGGASCPVFVYGNPSQVAGPGLRCRCWSKSAGWPPTP